MFEYVQRASRVAAFHELRRIGGCSELLTLNLSVGGADLTFFSPQPQHVGSSMRFPPGVYAHSGVLAYLCGCVHGDRMYIYIQRKKFLTQYCPNVNAICEKQSG